LCKKSPVAAELLKIKGRINRDRQLRSFRITAMARNTPSSDARQRGFSLIELLIVVAIILIIAAIAIPNFLKSKMSANEAATVVSLRTLGTAMITYQSQCPAIGYPGTLVDLGPSVGSGCVGGANIVDNILGSANPQKSGYSITYVPIPAGGGLNGSYTLNADPQSRGVSGQRSFYTDPTGVIRYNQTAAAISTDNPLQ
jgi:type IV pilus assembly protein PilA